MSKKPYRKDSDFPEMPKAFWNHPYNPITGFHYTKRNQTPMRAEEKYNKKYEILKQ